MSGANSSMPQLALAAAGFAQRFRLTRLLDHATRRYVMGAYVAINCAITILILGAIAVVSHEPMVFPSLGPSAFVLFFLPLGVQSAPKNVVLGQLIAVVCGIGALLTFGLYGRPPNLDDISWHRVLAAALALSLTAVLMVLFNVLHAPAGATAMIVALGLIDDWSGYVWMMVAVVLLTLQAFAINRLAGLPYPVWRPVPMNTDPMLRELQ